MAVAPDQDGLFRSRVFPGLWLDPAALLAGDRAASAPHSTAAGPPGHAAFVANLAAALREPLTEVKARGRSRRTR